MRNHFSKLLIFSLLISSMIHSAIAHSYERHDEYRQQSHEQRRDNREGERRDDRSEQRTDERRDSYRKEARILPVPNHRGGHKVIVVPRKRVVRNIHIYRPHGHAYAGYGHYHDDNDAWKWLAFTAITLKLLDNLNEQAQREHEAAQVKATTAEVGETINWHTDSASGSVVTVREGTDTTGKTCREYQQTITVGGKTEQAYGTACLQDDGAWKIIS